MLSISEPPKTGGTGSLCLSDLSSKDKPWDIHKASAEIVERLYQQIGYDKYAERMSECAKWLQFVLESSLTDEMILKLWSSRFCRVRHCPVCQWRRSLMWRARFLSAMPKVIRDYPKYRYLFLTLTVRNCHITDLGETVTQMNKAWSKLTRRKQFPAEGFVKSLEVTRNPNDSTAHPHIHALLMVKPSYFSTGYLSHKAWRQLWQSCLKIDYLPMVNIKPVRGKRGSDVSQVEDLIQALCETLKYSVKEADLVSDAEWLGELTRQLDRKRSISVGGILRGYIREDDPEDLIHGDDEPDADLSDAPKLIFDWSHLIKKYNKRSD